MKLTVVFYENPAALAEIDFWEKSKGKDILEKQINGDDIAFVLENEVVFCTPIGKPNVLTIYKYLDSEAFVYNKTLIFGRVTSHSLIYTNAYILKFETYK